MPRRKKFSSANQFWTTNTARYHQGHEEHTKLLAIPNFRRLEITDEKDVPNLNLTGGPIWPIRKATMKTQPNARIKKLAISKHTPEIQNKKDKPRLDLHLAGTYPGGHYASEGARRAVCDNRIHHLAVPNARTIQSQKEEFYNILKPEFKKQLDILEDMNTRTIYYIKPITISQLQLVHKRRGWPRPSDFMIEDDMDDYTNRIDFLSKPKKEFLPEELPKSKKMPVAYLEKHLERITAQSERKKEPEIKLSDVFVVSPDALAYKITDRLQQLVPPKVERVVETEEGPPPREKVSLHKWKDLQTNMVKLSQHRDRKNAKDMDLRENAYQVNPKALVAKCTNRMKALAVPKGGMPVKMKKK